MPGEDELVSAHPAVHDQGHCPHQIKLERDGSTDSAAIDEDSEKARDARRKLKPSRRMSSKKSSPAGADSANTTPKSAAKKASKKVRQDQSIMGVSMLLLARLFSQLISSIDQRFQHRLKASCGKVLRLRISSCVPSLCEETHEALSVDQ